MKWIPNTKKLILAKEKRSRNDRMKNNGGRYVKYWATIFGDHIFIKNKIFNNARSV